MISMAEKKMISLLFGSHPEDGFYFLLALAFLCYGYMQKFPYDKINITL